ncbi:Serine transporter [Providencia rustigianii]|uniref:Serine transporter n=2 Tax=Providencia rustigianii TaxID=158850 RepID=D1NXC1_9GAMM|nr:MULTISPECIES: serine/threonine transporter [Providencia]EFB74060.1 serine transporter [Providencia rustigianii DSM 4541]MTC57011.1 HAAAP family serine/threonine permease [Providencia rustigianii]MTC61700.1 HAAAP family serine/threonine permease [Providencia rustigianii]SPY77008.1 Serine transporter [Providencia rustigianii]SUC26255.1 Serine transporter [Providencia rustigianii]
MDATKVGSINTTASQTGKSTAWRKTDTVWMLGLYGTAIGAGVLFLPINAGMSGLLPVLLMLVLAFPMTFFAHRGLTRFVLSGSKKDGDITEVVEEHFGRTAGNWITLLYFFAIYPILLVYGVSITNNVNKFLTELIGVAAPPRWLLALILVGGVMAIVAFGEKYIVKVMSFLVFPFIAVLVAFSIYMIPHWSADALDTLSLANVAETAKNTGGQSIWITIWLTIPVMVFAFNHSPIISAFSVAKREEYDEAAEKKCSRILASAHILMVFTVMFFVISCVFTLSSADLAAAKAQNISILDYLSGYFDQPFIKYTAAIIAFIAIIKSFLGHYLGAREGFNGLVERAYRAKGKTVNIKKLNRGTAIFMLITTWLVATWNPGVLEIIESLGGPVIAILLFLMPMYAISKVPAMRKYSGKLSNIFVVIMGLVAISAATYKLFF